MPRIYFIFEFFFAFEVPINEYVLEEDFPENLEMFESNSHLISLPEKLKADCLEILIKYLNSNATLSVGKLKCSAYYTPHELKKITMNFILLLNLMFTLWPFLFWN